MKSVQMKTIMAGCVWTGLVHLSSVHALTYSPMASMNDDVVLVKRNTGNQYTFNQYDSLDGIKRNSIKKVSTANWGASALKVVVTGRDTWLSITRFNNQNCFAKYSSYQNFTRNAADRTKCNAVIDTDAYRGVAYDGKLFYVLMYSASNKTHYWQTHTSWDNVIINKQDTNRQATNTHVDGYKGIGYDKKTKLFYSLFNNGQSSTWYLLRYVSYVDMVKSDPRQSVQFIASPNAYVGLSIGSVDKILEVFITAGQSNAVGWNTKYSELPKSIIDNNIKYYYREGAKVMKSSDIVRTGVLNLGKDFTNNSKKADGLYGFGIELAARGIYNTTNKSEIAVVKTAVGGSRLVDHWSFKTDHGLGNALINDLNHAASQWKKEGYRVKVVGVFWMQGESDARNLTFAKAYEANLTQFIKTLRTWSNEDCLPVVLGKIRVDWQYASIVRAAQQTVVSKDKCSRLVSTDDLPSQATDKSHLSSDSQYKLALRMAVTYQSIISNHYEFL